MLEKKRISKLEETAVLNSPFKTGLFDSSSLGSFIIVL